MRSSFHLLLLATLCLTARADQAGPGQAGQGAELETITVVAHRQPRQLAEVAGTVTIIGSERIARDMAVDLNELVRYEPGVEVDSGGTRFGFNGFRIRGVGQNRTAIVIDNVPAPDRFSVGSFADTGRGLMELGQVQRVEILRGPASTLYGSKALGGVVAVSLIDSDDLLMNDRDGHRLQLHGATDSDRFRLAQASAFASDRNSLLLSAAALRASEVDVAGRPGTTPVDSLDRRQGAFLMRTARELDSGRVRLSLDGLRETRKTDIRAMLGSGRLVSTSALNGDDRRNQWRMVLDQKLEPTGVIDRGQWRSWYQHSDTRQETLDLRPNAATPLEVRRRFELRQENLGLGADFETELTLLGRSNRLGYGFETARTKVSNKRDGLQTNLATGATTTVIIGEAFPLRDFPTSEITELGLYLQNEIELWSGGIRLTPGIRFEYYDLSLASDPLFEAAFPNAETTELSTTAWMPRIGLLWPLGPRMELFAQYARGFRAPPFDDVNIGLEYAQFNVRAIANPELRPERGRTMEAGLRWRGDHARAELALFRNHYRDFIQTRAPLGFDPVSGFVLFQSINRDRVRIEGVEARYRREIGHGLTVELAGEWTRGEDRVSGRSLAEISPPRLIGEVSWQSPAARFETRLIASATRAQRQLEDESGQALFAPPGHMTIDWLGRWFPGSNLSVGLGLFNLTDRHYWRAASVIGRQAEDPTLPLLAEPGRAAKLSLDWRF